MSEVQIYEPDDFILGPDAPVSATGMLIGGQKIARLTPLVVDSTAKSFKAWDGTTGSPVALSCFAEDSSVGALPFSYYHKGQFRATAIAWPAGMAGNTTAQQSAFAGTAISVG